MTSNVYSVNYRIETISLMAVGISCKQTKLHFINYGFSCSMFLKCRSYCHRLIVCIAIIVVNVIILIVVVLLILHSKLSCLHFLNLQVVVQNVGKFCFVSFVHIKISVFNVSFHYIFDALDF